MIIGLVLPSTPNYSETFFTNKIRGLQANNSSVVLFVQTKRPGFDLCPVYKRPKVIKNRGLQMLIMLWTMLALLPQVNRVRTYYKLSRKSGVSHLEILKGIYLNSHILKRKLDWLHFGFTTQAIGSETVAKAIGAKMAVSFRGFDINVYPKKHKHCYNHVWKHVDKIHSISEYLVKEAYKLGLDHAVPVAIIPPAIDLDTIAHIDKRDKGNLDDMVICMVARLNWIKDITTALKAVKIIKETHPKIVFNIIGSGTLKEKERYLLITHQLNLKENVRFYDQLEHRETLQFIKDCDIYLQTSLNEGFCNAVLEAQALGKLCVATNVGGMQENIIDGKTGWLVEAQAPSVIAKKIVEIQNLTTEEKSKIASNAKKRVGNQFNLKDQILAFNHFYSH